jgi:hypothetical protein
VSTTGLDVIKNKIDKKYNTLNSYRSHQTSIERINETETHVNIAKLVLTDDEFKEDDTKESYNRIHGYKIKVPFKEKKNLKSTLNLQNFNNISCNLMSENKMPSSRKVWRKK